MVRVRHRPNRSVSLRINTDTDTLDSREPYRLLTFHVTRQPDTLVFVLDRVLAFCRGFFVINTVHGQQCLLSIESGQKSVYCRKQHQSGPTLNCHGG